MSTATAVRAPACLHIPPGRAGSFVDDVGTIAENIGRPLLPEQAIAVDALTSYDRRGRFLTVEAGLEMPRQNGKTGGIMLPIFAWSVLTDPDLFVWTAHQLDTSAKAFQDWAGKADDDQGLVKNCDWLRRRVQSVSYENGAEGISFVNGAQLDFRARSAKRGRGISGSTVGLDEWLFGTSDQQSAILPILATRSLHGNARAYYLSSAALSSSSALKALRKRALAGDPTLTYVGWWAPGSWTAPGCVLPGCVHALDTPGCALDDESLWVASNPMEGRLTSLDFLRGMRRTFADDPMKFAREFMGWEEPEDGGGSPISGADWSSCLDFGSRLAGRKVFSFDVALDQSAAWVGVAGRRSDDVWHVELVDARPGTDWLDDRVCELAGRWGGPFVLDPAGPAGAHRVALERRGVRLVEMTARDTAQAAGAFLEATVNRALRHIGQDPLDAAVRNARKRDLAEAWAWGRKKSTAEIGPLTCVSAALWGAESVPDDTFAVFFDDEPAPSPAQLPAAAQPAYVRFTDDLEPDPDLDSEDPDDDDPEEGGTWLL